MKKASDYHIDGNQRVVYMPLGDSLVALRSGDLACARCGHRIPDKEMFCIPCFGTKVALPRARTEKPKPDEGSLFEEELGDLRGEQDIEA